MSFSQEHASASVDQRVEQARSFSVDSQKSPLIIPDFHPEEIQSLLSKAQNIELNINIGNDDKFDQWKEIYEKVLQIDPYDYFTNFYLGMLFYRQNDENNKHKALEYLKKALEWDHNSTVLFNIAIIYTELEDYKMAEEYYLKLLKWNQEYNDEVLVDAIKTQNITVYQNLAMNAYNQENVDKMIDYYKEGLKLDPKNFTFLYNLGLWFFQKHKYSQSIKCLNKAILCNIHSINENQAYFALGEAYEKMDKFDEALKTFKQLQDKGYDDQTLAVKLESLESKIMDDDKLYISDNDDKKTSKSIKFSDSISYRGKKSSKSSKTSLRRIHKALDGIYSSENSSVHDVNKLGEIPSNSKFELEEIKEITGQDQDTEPKIDQEPHDFVNSLDEVKGQAKESDANTPRLLNTVEKEENKEDLEDYELWNQQKWQKILRSSPKNEFAHFRLGVLSFENK